MVTITEYDYTIYPGLHSVLLLTKVDQVCHVTHEDVSRVFFSRAIQSVVEHMSGKLSIQVHDVLPVVNYGIYSRLQCNQSTQGTLVHS